MFAWKTNKHAVIFLVDRLLSRPLYNDWEITHYREQYHWTAGLQFNWIGRIWPRNIFFAIVMYCNDWIQTGDQLYSDIPPTVSVHWLLIYCCFDSEDLPLDLVAYFAIWRHPPTEVPTYSSGNLAVGICCCNTSRELGVLHDSLILPNDALLNVGRRFWPPKYLQGTYFIPFKFPSKWPKIIWPWNWDQRRRSWKLFEASNPASQFNHKIQSSRSVMALGKA